MGSYIQQRTQYLDKVLMLHKEGMGAIKISKFVPIGIKTLQRWINRYSLDAAKSIHTMKKTKPLATEPTLESPPDVKTLEAEIKSLKGQLKLAEIKVEAYTELINVAEAKFNIPIRKKAGAKQ